MNIVAAVAQANRSRVKYSFGAAGSSSRLCAKPIFIYFTVLLPYTPFKWRGCKANQAPITTGMHRGRPTLGIFFLPLNPLKIPVDGSTSEFFSSRHCRRIFWPAVVHAGAPTSVRLRCAPRPEYLSLRAQG